MSYGCKNREAFATEQVLHGISRQTGQPVRTVVPFRMSVECQYTQFDRYNDQGCVGCCHRKGPQ